MEEGAITQPRLEAQTDLRLCARCLVKYRLKQPYLGVEVYIHAFLISTLDGAAFLASRAVLLTVVSLRPILFTVSFTDS
jgi:hypothetical protein